MIYIMVLSSDKWYRLSRYAYIDSDLPQINVLTHAHNLVHGVEYTLAPIGTLFVLTHTHTHTHAQSHYTTVQNNKSIMIISNFQREIKLSWIRISCVGRRPIYMKNISLSTFSHLKFSGILRNRRISRQH